MTGRALRPRAQRAGGFTYIGAMLLVAVLALGATAVAELFVVVSQRDRERELIFTGRQFAAAIDSFKKRSGAAPQPYPTALAQLLRDPRFPNVVRHLRRVYVDPITGQPDWGLVRNARGGIVGVYSLSRKKPVKRANFPEDLAFGGAASYRGWRFLAPGAEFEQLAVVAAVDPEKPQPAPPESDPVSPVAPPPANPAPVPPRIPSLMDDVRNHTPEGCDRIRANDLAVCMQSESRFGARGGTDCRNSAAIRYGACLATPGGLLPPLYIPRS